MRAVSIDDLNLAGTLKCDPNAIFQQDLFGVLTHPGWWKAVIHLGPRELHGRSNEWDWLTEARKVHLDLHVSRPWLSTRCKGFNSLNSWDWYLYLDILYILFTAKDAKAKHQETEHEGQRRLHPNAKWERSPPSRLPASPATTTSDAVKWSHSRQASPPGSKKDRPKRLRCLQSVGTSTCGYINCFSCWSFTVVWQYQYVVSPADVQTLVERAHGEVHCACHA